jgi:hypothetical protein
VRSAMLVADNITWHLSADTPAVGKETRYFSITDSYVTPDDRLMAVFVAADRSGRNLRIGNPLAFVPHEYGHRWRLRRGDGRDGTEAAIRRGRWSLLHDRSRSRDGDALADFHRR